MHAGCREDLGSYLENFGALGKIRGGILATWLMNEFVDHKTCVCVCSFPSSGRVDV